MRSKTEEDDLLSKVVPHDLVKYGLIPELVGRVPVITTLNHLDEPALVTILSKPKNAILKQYTRLFELDGIKLEFEEDALRAVAKQAIERKTGARGLRAIMEDVLGEQMFSAPSDATIDKIVVTEQCVTEKAAPKIEHDPNKTPVSLKLPGKKVAARVRQSGAV